MQNRGDLVFNRPFKKLYVTPEIDILRYLANSKPPILWEYCLSVQKEQKKYYGLVPGSRSCFLGPDSSPQAGGDCVTVDSSWTWF